MSSNSSIEQKADIQHHEIDMLPTANVVVDHSTGQMQTHAVSSLAKIHPAPIGFGAFALCSFVLGLYNSGLITNLPQVAVGVAFGYGAMGQFICGICEIVIGNIFAAASMLTFSGFFFTFGIMMIPSSGFLQIAMENGGLETVHKCMGLVQIGYAIAAFLFFLGTLRQPILIRLVLFQVFLAFFCGGIGGLTGIVNFNIASGWISFTLSLTAWYVMAALLYTPENTMIKLPFF
ncbi:GPR1/FUN34/yaaH family-domain-containing protein [Cokeromyces recurvatus]|uniref:GPR1/FUN34/yaaH family-domain-containing protein n=1 Tax=Cokeromyces recurvatus TaxID=90255 RepID=UPI0022200E84|nr:GPR1/FUN34/yaaH family-domain-containing protein [Cokeromyces recurvatus]KAI7901941.1 GPR1/FUN34/yaaH family-domain-containing protein [Cokeromyces recurvatus]